MDIMGVGPNTLNFHLLNLSYASNIEGIGKCINYRDILPAFIECDYMEPIK